MQSGKDHRDRHLRNIPGSAQNGNRAIYDSLVRIFLTGRQRDFMLVAKEFFLNPSSIEPIFRWGERGLRIRNFR
jgi:hypothetical protein